MPPGQLDVPALPVLLPLGLALMALSWWLLRRRGLLSGRRLAVAWSAGWYAVAVLGATLLPLHVAWGVGPPEFYRIIAVPLVTMRVGDFVLNIVMTLPLAAVLRLVAGVRDRRRVVLTGLALSAVIETVQLVLCLFLDGNRWADTNDLIANTLGAWLGWLALRRLLRFAAVRRTADSCAITRPAHPACRS